MNQMAMRENGTMQPESTDSALLRIEDLRVEFPKQRSLADFVLGRQARVVKAVDGISFHVRRGETVGLVGESGSGKTTVGRAILRLIKPLHGQVIFEGEEIFALDPQELGRFRRRVQMVFQDPYSSLNPRLRIGSALAEALHFHEIVSAELQPGQTQF